MLFYSLGLIISCSDPCGVDGPVYFKATNYNSAGIKLTGTDQLSSQEFYTFALIHTNKFVSYDSLGILIQYEIETMAYQDFQWGHVNAAYACSPAEIYQSLDDVVITSDTDYNQQYPAGTDLSNIIAIRNGLRKEGFTMPDYLNQYALLDRNQILITFTVPPDKSATHNISIQLDLNDQDEFVNLNLENLPIK